MIKFFFFFYHGLEDEPVIREAFRQICAEKLFSDLYCDMDEYFSARIIKKEMLRTLEEEESVFADLYKNPYPTEDQAYAKWNDIRRKYEEAQYAEREKRRKAAEADAELYKGDALMNKRAEDKRVKDKLMEDKLVSDNQWTYKRQPEVPQLKEIEAKAIVNWIYRIYPGKEARQEETCRIMETLSAVYGIPELAFEDTIIYVKSKVKINMITSFTQFCNKMLGIENKKRAFYYRGHSDSAFLLQPSVMRKESWISHERDMYNEIKIECPQEFSRCKSHLDFLVHMQHYGLPTRLLDVTKNPLVALYFACETNPGKSGEIIVFEVDREELKYPGSDTVSILASLPLFTSAEKDEIYRWASDRKLSQEDFNKKAVRLLHEIKLEKPAFRDELRKEDLTDVFFVLSEKKNPRIMKQDGAFIICGLFERKKNPINRYRLKRENKIQIFIVKSRAKKGIMRQLNKLSINKAGLFPEIEDVAEYIKNKFAED